MIKFIHCADLHLDSPFLMQDAKKAAERRSELRGTFSRLIEEAKSFSADLVLIAGDLFDRKIVTKNTLDLASSLFASFPQCKFIISPGNHDFYSPDSVWEKAAFPENVFVFKSENMSSITFENVGKDGEKVNIYGYAFTSRSMQESPLSGGVSGISTDEINILCGHADIFEKGTTYCPMTVSQISSSDFDYVALGHVHNGGGIFCENGTYYGYSGSLEGQSFNDCGERGAYFVTLGKSEGKAICKSEFVPLASRTYAVETLNVSGCTDTREILEKASELSEKLRHSERTLLRLILIGDISPSVTIPTEAIRSVFSKFFFIEIQDETLPLFDCEDLMNDLTVKGAFFRELAPMLKSEDERERIVAAKALRYGLAALSGAEVIDI